jgi:hypothetical protein
VAKTYILKALLYLDVFAGSLLWRNQGLTISSYCGLALRHRRRHDIVWRGLGRVLNWIERDHCEGAIRGDMERLTKSLEILKDGA